MRSLRLVIVVFCAFFMWGCIENDTVVHVRPNGSGFVEETVMLSKAMLQSVQAFSDGLQEGGKEGKGGSAEKQDPAEEMMKDAGKRSSQYGPNVRFVSATPAKTEDMSGYKAIYAFDDINTLKINQNPGSKVSKPGEKKDNSPKKEEMVLFKLVKGPVSTLTITMPEAGKTQEKKEKKEEESKAAEDPEAEKAMGAFFKGMRISVAVKVEGTVVKTNATHREGGLITMLDMDFGKILENKEAFKKLTSGRPETVEEIKAFAKNIKGLKIETNNPVVVEFR